MRSAAFLVAVGLLVGCTPAADPEVDTAPVAEVSYDVFPPAVQFGDTPKATLRNAGEVPLEYGDAYRLERDFGGEWVELAQPEGADIACVDKLETYLMHPGSTRTQEISLCDNDGATHPLAPGRYRITKTVQTIAAASGAETQAITEVAAFEVAEARGPVPGPSVCEVLCLSGTKVRAGDSVTVTFDPPMRFIWGARS